MKETHYKLKHRVTALFAAAVMLCSMLPGAAFAEEPTPQPTEETVQMEQQTEPSETDNGQTDESSPDPGEDVTEATPETAEEQPAEEEIPAAVRIIANGMGTAGLVGAYPAYVPDTRELRKEGGKQ